MNSDDLAKESLVTSTWSILLNLLQSRPDNFIEIIELARALSSQEDVEALARIAQRARHLAMRSALDFPLHAPPVFRLAPRYVEDIAREIALNLPTAGHAHAEMEDELHQLSSELSSTRNELHETLARLHAGVDMSRARIRRYLTVRMFVADPLPPKSDFGELVSAVEAFAEEFEFEVVGDAPEEWGSWWKRIFLRSRDLITADEVTERASKIERGLQAQYIRKPEAEAMKAQAEGVAALIKSVENLSEAAIQVGPILLIKHSDKVLVKTLSFEQQSEIEQNQALLRNPGNLADWVDCLPSNESSTPKLALSSGGKKPKK